MQIYGDNTSTEQTTKRWSCSGSDRSHLGRIGYHSVSKPRARRRLHLALRRQLNTDGLHHRLAARTSRLHVSCSGVAINL